MVLGKLPVPGRPFNLADSRARAYCACSGCGWGLFGHFYPHLSFLFSFSLSLGDGPIKTEIMSQRTVNSKTTNQPTAQGANSNDWNPSYGVMGVVAVLLFYVHGKQLRSCRDGQLT